MSTPGKLAALQGGPGADSERLGLTTSKPNVRHSTRAGQVTNSDHRFARSGRSRAGGDRLHLGSLVTAHSSATPAKAKNSGGDAGDRVPSEHVGDRLRTHCQCVPEWPQGGQRSLHRGVVDECRPLRSQHRPLHRGRRRLRGHECGVAGLHRGVVTSYRGRPSAGRPLRSSTVRSAPSTASVEWSALPAVPAPWSGHECRPLRSQHTPIAVRRRRRARRPIPAVGPPSRRVRRRS